MAAKRSDDGVRNYETSNKTRNVEGRCCCGIAELMLKVNSNKLQKSVWLVNIWKLKAVAFLCTQRLRCRLSWKQDVGYRHFNQQATVQTFKQSLSKRQAKASPEKPKSVVIVSFRLIALSTERARAFLALCHVWDFINSSTYFFSLLGDSSLSDVEHAEREIITNTSSGSEAPECAINAVEAS